LSLGGGSGQRIYGWVDIARASGVPLARLKAAAQRKVNPAPIYVEMGKIVAPVGQLHRWAIKEALAAKGGVGFGDKEPVFEGRKSLNGPGIYAIAAGAVGCIRIGWTGRLSKTLERVGDACPVPVELSYWIMAPKPVLAELHGLLGERNCRLDWFYDAADTRAVLTEAVKRHGGAWVPR
jgi:hypothetical protein